MVDMFARQSYLTVPSLVSHLADHTPGLMPEISERCMKLKGNKLKSIRKRTWTMVNSVVLTRAEELFLRCNWNQHLVVLQGHDIYIDLKVVSYFNCVNGLHCLS